MPRVELSAGMSVRAIGLALGYLTAALLGIALGPRSQHPGVLAGKRPAEMRGGRRGAGVKRR